jgi:NADH-quinone oxidoreductase subunit L
MGGLWKRTPLTFATMLCAAVAIAGVPPFSGFHSKDAILLAAHHHAPWMYWIGVLTAAMTAFYVFRAIFLAFLGDYRGSAHPHESPPAMSIPLVVLGLFSLWGGYFNVLPWLEPIFPAAEPGHDALLVYVSVAAGLAGIALAWLFYVARPGWSDAFAAKAGGLYRLVLNKYYVDELYNAAIVNPLRDLAGWLARAFDQRGIDGAVNGMAGVAGWLGAQARRLQTGLVGLYALSILFGAVALLAWLVIR